MSEGLVAVQARISQIQALVQGVSPTRKPALVSTAAGSGSTSGASGTTFDEVMAKAGSGVETSSLGEQAVEIAKKYLGIDYRWGGTDPKTGLDCSGLTQLVYGQLGVSLPRVSGDQAKAGTKVASMSDAKVGDLVFFGSPVHHVGIYIGDGKMLDAPRTGKQVQIRNVYETPSAIRRVLPETGASSVSALLSSSGSTAGGGSTGSLGATPYAQLFTAAGKRYGVDPALLSAVAKAESAYRPDAVSPAGARGLMQLMPGTARDLAVDPDVPSQAVDGAARLLAGHLRTFNGRVDLALAAYNAGPGAVRKYGGVPPFDETRTYVQRVTKNWGELR
jgi:hypothetical protein